MADCLPLALDAVRHAHFVGIGGSGMSGLARLFRERGQGVSGCDARPGPASDALVAHGVPVYTGHAAAHVDAADLVVVTAAVAHDNPEVRAARARGIPVLSHADVLGLLTARALGIAIAGTHGKTTTTALVGFLLERAGRDPTILAGAEMLNYGASVRLGRGPHVVVEADEYDRRFLRLTPRVAVVTSVEADHLDYFRDLAEIEATFAAFVDRLPAEGRLIACADDAGARRLAAPQRIAYGLTAQAGWRARACRAAALADAPGEEALPRYGMEFVAVAPDGAEAAVRLPLVGRHNVANALAALAVAHGEGVPLAEAVAALPAFRGTRRRFQPLGRARGVAVVDDYAHHPTAVRATLAAARAVHAGPLWVAFQPHTRNRTSRLLAEFAAALALADGVLVTAIYEPVGREREPIAVSGADLAARVSGPPAVYVPDLESAAAYLAARLPPGALLLTMGAGDVDRLGPLVLEALGAAR
ncbi:MAG TPA: UDP-N-acetylmuramate--L-alanine ligase [Chloroflexota bacterium]|nr:UDP-N-acetylmuramate--L-alanine ligase [Chloroflexota bacterium]